MEQVAREIFLAGVEAVQPQRLIERSVRLEAENLVITGFDQQPTTIPLPKGRLILLAFGKAVLGMAQAVADLLKDKLSDSVVLVPQESPLDETDNRHNLRIYRGAQHNQPDQAALIGANALLQLARSATEVRDPCQWLLLLR